MAEGTGDAASSRDVPKDESARRLQLFIDRDLRCQHARRRWRSAYGPGERELNHPAGNQAERSASR